MDEQVKEYGEPWRKGGVFPFGAHGEDKQILDCDRTIIGRVHCLGPGGNDDAERRVARLIACVNACAGIADPATLRRERDELREACEKAERVLAGQRWLEDGPDPEAVALKSLRAALASTKGGDA